MHTVALAAGKLANLLLLVAALKRESASIGARIDLGLAELDDIGATGNLLPHGLVGIERVAALVYIADLHRGADLQRTRIRHFLAGEHAKQRGLAGAIGADHTD